MATKDEVHAAIALLGTKVDDFIASHTGQTSDEVQKLLDEQKAKLTAEDATMDAADFGELQTGIMDIVNRVPAKFDPSANG